MATAFPTGLDSYTDPLSGDKLSNPGHAGQHTDKNDALEAVEAKVGIDGSAVVASHDYKLSNTVGTNKALAGPVSPGNWKILYQNGSGVIVELAHGADNTVLKGEGVTAAPTFGIIQVGEIDGGNWKLLYTDGSGNVQELALSASGQVLTSGGVAAAPSFQDAPVIDQATQSAVEAQTNQDTYVPPDLLKHHPGIAKVHCRVLAGGGTVTLQSGSLNVASVTRTQDGIYSINYDTDFSSGNHSGVASHASGGGKELHVQTPTASAMTIIIQANDAPFAFVVGNFNYVAFGDQA